MIDMDLFKDKVNDAIETIQRVYLTRNNLVGGYSGGKDSTVAIGLLWTAVGELPPEKRTKPITVISNNTLVEQPYVSAWVTRSLRKMNDAAKEQGIPLTAHQLIPELKDRYWVNLLGRRYAAPRSGFRWCTDRLKINASNRFIRDSISQNGEAIMVLGTRKDESATRARLMEKYEKNRTEAYLSPNGKLQNSYVLSPIEDFTTDEVWMWLMSNQNHWGHSHKELLAMYRGATEGNECPLVQTSENGKVTTPSCGSSRFGCFVCTMVSRDKSMNAMIANDVDKEWLLPLVELRDEIARLGDKNKISDYDVRDFRRTGGGIKLYRNTGMPIPGPYTREHSQYLFRRVLETHKLIKQTAPPDMKDIQVIRLDEIMEIRRLWLEKHEFEDAVPRIFEEVFGFPLPVPEHTRPRLGMEEWEMLETLTGGDPMEFERMYSLLDIASTHTMFGAKKSITNKIEEVIRQTYYTGPEDAGEFHRKQTNWKPPVESGETDSYTEDEDVALAELQTITE